MRYLSLLFARLWLVAFFAVFQSGALWAQDLLSQNLLGSSKPDFGRGMAAFNQGAWDEALGEFAGIVASGPKHEHYTAALFMQGRTDYELGRINSADDPLRQLIESHPQSRYTEHAHLLLGMIAFQEGNYAQSASEFIWVIDFGKTEDLKRQAVEYAEILFDDYLQPSDLRRRLRRDYLGENGLALIALRLSRHELAQGRRGEGQRIIEEFLRLHPNNVFRKQLEQWQSVPDEPGPSRVRIGVILPLSGSDVEAGKALLRGIQFAQLNAGYNGQQLAHASSKDKPVSLSLSESPVEFVVRDSESSTIGALKAAQALLAEPGLVALIGEIDGNASSAIAGLAQEKSIPILVPAATDDGITSLGPNVFQMNSDRERKGRALAEYAYNYLRCRTFVTIAPQDVYGQQMTDGFSVAADSLGAEILTQKWYYGEPTDLGRHFKAIREVAFQRGRVESEHVANALVESDTGAPAAHESRSASGLVNALSVPVTNIGGIFLPLYLEDIRLIAYQRISYNIQGIPLGGEYWQTMDMDTRKELQRYVDGAVFASDYYVDWESERGKQFRNTFRKLMGATPDKYDVLGYDAASLMLSCLKNGARRPDQLRRALAEVDNYAGMKGEISLNNPRRVNSRVNILQLSGVDIKRIR